MLLILPLGRTVFHRPLAQKRGDRLPNTCLIDTVTIQFRSIKPPYQIGRDKFEDVAETSLTLSQRKVLSLSTSKTRVWLLLSI